MDIHEFSAHEGMFAADEFADDAQGFAPVDELDLPFPVRSAVPAEPVAETDDGSDVA